MRKRRRRGSSKAGRPKKAGARYPSGKLKAPGPNAVTQAKRRAGDASAGEHPMDFALSNGWVTERQHRDASAYRAAFDRAHGGGANGPRLALSRYPEVEPSEALRADWATMSDAEIVEIFDRVFSGAPVQQEREAANRGALAKWRALNAALSHAERQELFLVCIMGSWPFWMPKRAADQVLGATDAAKQRALLDGLTVVARALRPPRPPRSTISPVPKEPTRAGRTELPVRYVTEDGDELQPESERGAPFEVAILRKRA